MKKRTVLCCFIHAFLCMHFTSCNDRAQLFKKLDLAKAGITFENKITPTEDFNIIDYLYFYNGGGVAIGDINNDQLPDIFFSGNQTSNKLYINKGDLQFEDISDKAGIGGKSSWKTGAVMGDVNNDGLLDIYVCAVVGLKGMKGHNELYINNGDGTFSERAAEFGLDFDTYSSSAAFLDFDLDGDLDIYLLNHAVHTQESFGHANLRNKRSYEAGDKLLRNDGSRFVDVSEQANIYGGIIGYGLGLAVSDFNVDGYPDIYVGNDFHEDDYYYLNNGNGTFREASREAILCTSKFSMGNDVADINHDGYPDLITLDMLPQDEAVLKRSEVEENINILKMRTEKYGYRYQFVRNMMHINQGNGKFAETALMSGVAATDWSWSALFSDFDQDGHQDLFISNGIPRRPNDLDYMKYVSNEQVAKMMGTTKLVDEKALALMPSGKAQNCIFKGDGGYGFVDKSTVWLPDEINCSTSTALSDLDNDGDLDIVTNNVNDKPGIYVNQTNSAANYLKVKLNYTKQNSFGIGTRLYAFVDGVMQMKEMYTIRGFQASSEPVLHFGLGAHTSVDSMHVVWPDGKRQKMVDVKANQSITLSPGDQLMPSRPFVAKSSSWFRQVEPADIGLDYQHKEDKYTDFDRLKLLPYQQSDRGPATSLGDLNNDGKVDIFFGGSKQIPSEIYLQSDKGFIRTAIPQIRKDSVKEDVDAVIADFNLDGKNDLFIGTGGADFYGKSNPLLDSYYRSETTGFSLSEIPDYYENASCVKACDFDSDGDLDLFIGNESVSNNFGSGPKSCLLINNKGTFSAIQTDLFNNLGMVTDALWDDYDGDGQMDLIVVGEWMAPVFLRNQNGTFVQEFIVPEKLNGLWQSVSAFDIDHDGDKDYVMGNWGLNSKYTASESRPLKMLYNDFDKNGQSETVIAIAKGGKYYPFDGLDLMASQLPILRKRFTSYSAFAGKTIDELFSAEQMKDGTVLEVHQLASGYLRNDGDTFTFVPLPLDAQLAPILAQLKFDFDNDGTEELLLGGNYFGVQPYHGRFGSFSGAVVKNANTVVKANTFGLDLIGQSVRHFNILPYNGEKYLLVTVNNSKIQLFKLVKYEKGILVADRIPVH